MSKYFDQMWRKRHKKKNKGENELPKSFSSIENVKIPNKARFKEEKKY